MVKPEVVIDVSEVSYTYAPAMPLALDHVSLQIHKGDFLALLGQNGAGKTTLAKTFNGLLRPASGSVTVGGLDTRNATIASLAARVGYCYQNPDHQIFNRTVYMEAAFGPRNLKLAPEEVAARVDHALHLVGLADQRDAYPFLLGKGERQMLAVASALAMGSPILVVDEPTTGLDLRGIRSIMTLLKQWNENEGRTIVIITHDLHIVAEYIPRTIVMAQGKIVADGPTRSILSNGAVLAATGLKPPLAVITAGEPKCSKIDSKTGEHQRPGAMRDEHLPESAERRMAAAGGISLYELTLFCYNREHAEMI